MDDRSSLDRLRGDLLRRGLPRDHVERVIGELADHRSDLEAEAGPSASGRLGDPDRLADQLVSEYRGRSLLGRHSALSFGVGVLTYVVAPIPILALCWALSAGLVLALPAILLRDLIEGNLGFAAYRGFCQALGLVSFYGPMAGVAAIAARRVDRTGRGRRWLVATCLVLVILTGVFNGELRISTEVGQSMIMLGFRPSPATWNLLPMLGPVALGVALVRRSESPRCTATA